MFSTASVLFGFDALKVMPLTHPLLIVRFSVEWRWERTRLWRSWWGQRTARDGQHRWRLL